MDTFTVRVPHWPAARLVDRSPLTRVCDRIEALILVVAVAVAVLAVPIAAAVGTAVHDSRRHVYAEQGHPRHVVTATIVDDNASDHTLRAQTTIMQARWTAAGAEHTGTVAAPSVTKIGDRVPIWVDANGSQVAPSSPNTRAAIEAVTTAVAVWLSVAVAMAILFAGARAVCNRIRIAGWERDIEELVGR